MESITYIRNAIYLLNIIYVKNIPHMYLEYDLEYNLYNATYM